MATCHPRVGLTVLFALAFLRPSAGPETGLQNGTCFEDAVPAELRKNLTSMEGEPIPVTFLLAGWSSAQVTSSVIEILISEVMGYIIAVEPRAPASSLESIYCMLGCATWWNATSRGCETRKVKHHMMIDSWYLTYTHIINSLKEMYTEEMPVNAGSMGYPGQTGIYLPAVAVDEARNATGVALEYYANLDASWFTPSQYFADVTTVNTSDLMKCSDSLLSDNASAYGHFAQSGDVGGVDITTDGEGVKTYKYICQDGYFWLSSACRSDPTKCVPFITGGGGWDTLSTTQQAAAYNMPLALGVAASWSKFLEVPTKYKTMFYWWTPDNAFIEMRPSKLVLPPFNAYAWSQADYTTAADALPVTKIAPKDLQAMAPDISKLLEASVFDLEAVDNMMLNMKSKSLTREQVACDWLKGNTDRWKPWIPKATKCNPGFGLYDDATDTFTANRATATTCRACLPGMFSKAFTDDDGSTYICEACPAGQQQLGAGAMACDACPAGTAKAEQSTEECAPCAAGQYQDEKGALQCKMCLPGTTTMILGTKSISGCGCQAGSIDVSDLNSPHRLAADCIDCSEGLTCPVMSTVSALLAGSSPNGADFTPVVKRGYFSLEAEPIEVFKCLSTVQCPGGEPNICGGGREGVPCGECPADTYWAGSKCTGCSAWSVIGWIMCLILIFVGLVLAYYFMNAPMTSKASTLITTTCSIGMMINMLQSLGIVGTMTVEWPVNINGIFRFLQVFTFDIDGFAFACLAGENPVARYIGLVLFFPAALLWLQFCGLISKVKRTWAWDKIKLRSTMGQFLQVAFSTMSSTALVPMICYKHPNGQRSNLKYPNVFCGSDEHTAMVIAGSLMLVLGVCGFWAFAAWLAYMCPKFSAGGRYDLVQSGRFLLGRFRLDVWWYGVPLLLRGPLLALTVVLAPDYPAVQCLGCQIILMTFMAVQIYNWPWKAPILNVVDMVICFVLATLVVVAGFYVPVASGGLLTFFEIFSLVLFAVLFGVAGIMILASVLALFYRAAIGSQKELKIMTVGTTPPPAQIASELFDQIAALAGKPREHLAQKMGELGVYDLQMLQVAIAVLRSEVVETGPEMAQNFSRSTSRISSKSLTPQAAPKAKAASAAKSEATELEATEPEACEAVGIKQIYL